MSGGRHASTSAPRVGALDTARYKPRGALLERLRPKPRLGPAAAQVTSATSAKMGQRGRQKPEHALERVLEGFSHGVADFRDSRSIALSCDRNSATLSAAIPQLRGCAVRGPRLRSSGVSG